MTADRLDFLAVEMRSMASELERYAELAEKMRDEILRAARMEEEGITEQDIAETTPEL